MKPQQRNLILLTIDAWRPDFVDSHAGVALTPALDEVAQHTARFTSAYCTAPWTTPALVSVFTGQNVLRHRTHYVWSAPSPDRPALARLLSQAGYAVPNLCYLNCLDNYMNLGYSKEDAPDYPHSPADDLLLPALRAHKGRSEPFFLWFHYKFVHLPYWADAPYRSALGIDDDAIPERLRESVCSGFVVPRQEFRLLAEDRELVRRLYAAGVLQMNRWLSQVLEELCSGSLLSRTTLVLTSDHGEELLDHQHVGHASTAHHATLHEEVLRIPLLIIDNRIAGARRIEKRVHGPDLFPTLLSLAGVGFHGACDGVDLAPAILHGQDVHAPEDRAFLFHSARMGCPTPESHKDHVICGVSDGSFKFVRERYDALSEYGYDLRSDPRRGGPSCQGPLSAQAGRSWTA